MVPGRFQIFLLFTEAVASVFSDEKLQVLQIFWLKRTRGMKDADGVLYPSCKLALWQVTVARYRFPVTEMRRNVFWLQPPQGSEDTGNLLVTCRACCWWHSKGNEKLCALGWDVCGAQRTPLAPENMNYAICTFQLFVLNWPSRVWNPAQISPCCYAVECGSGKRKLISCHAFYSLWSNTSDFAR